MFQKRRGVNNLLPIQSRTLQEIRNNHDIIVVDCDKNLGPAVIERSTYIQRVLEHLQDETTYQYLTEQQAQHEEESIANQILEWSRKYKKDVSTDDLKYLHNQKSNDSQPCMTFPYFYMTPKVHKTPWKLRPITACRNTILYKLGVIVDKYLQQVAHTFDSYFKNSKELKDRIINIQLPPNAVLFTADAVSMYTNINTDAALDEISSYLRQNDDNFPSVPTEALIDALSLVMRNSVFTFGDTYWKQLTGAAMGQPPSPSYATTFFGIHEERIIPFYHPFVPVYFRFIDDVFGIWIKQNDPQIDEACWNDFKESMNSFHGLQWEFSERTNSVDFMDLTISIDNYRLITDLYEKSLNLYLYIPPLSSHPPGVLTGLILGNCHRIYTLVSSQSSRKQHINNFYKRLIARGYQHNTLVPLFQRAAQLATQRDNQLNHPHHHQNNRLTTTSDDEPRIYYHLRYHPNNPNSKDLQRKWKETISAPPYEKPLANLKNNQGREIGLSRMIVAYNRPPNLGNILSSKNISTKPGPPVSSFL